MTSDDLSVIHQRAQQATKDDLEAIRTRVKEDYWTVPWPDGATRLADAQTLLAHIQAQQEQIARLEQREANYHDVIAELNAVHDPELDEELQARVDAILINCDNPVCATLQQDGKDPT